VQEVSELGISKSQTALASIFSSAAETTTYAHETQKIEKRVITIIKTFQRALREQKGCFLSESNPSKGVRQFTLEDVAGKSYDDLIISHCFLRDRFELSGSA
jgi:hypothetical protein